jgi:hypothetical protein
MTDRQPLFQKDPGDALRILWDEYKYRHDLCWRVPVQLTAAAVILSTLPYVECPIVAILTDKILLVPSIGVVLTIFGVTIMASELRRLDIIREH